MFEPRRALLFFALASFGGLAAWRLAGRAPRAPAPRVPRGERSAPATPVPSPSTATVSTPEAKFGGLVAEVLAALPRRESGGGEELHHGSAAVREGGRELGRWKEALRENPDLAPRALEAYLACAAEADVLLPLRALCVANWRDLSRRGLDAPELSGVSSEVKALARRIPSD